MTARTFCALAVAAISLIALPSYSADAAVAASKKVYSLKDGGNLYVFKDGKMAREDRFGRAVFLYKGQLLETADGQKIEINSNEVARLDFLLREGHQN